MFYVKTSFGYADVVTEIHCDNVFTRCPECGSELNVDLAEVFSDGDADLESTSITFLFDGEVSLSIFSAASSTRLGASDMEIAGTATG